MDRAMMQRHLEEAMRHIALGEKHIASQEQVVEDLVRLGSDAAEAKKLLENFYASQAQHIAHRDRIIRELDDDGRAAGG